MVAGLQPEPLCFVSNCVEQWNWCSSRINENAFDKSIMAPSCINEEGGSLLRKMFTGSDCFDVTLVTGDGQQVFAHKAVLSTCRFYFKKSFK